MQTNHLPPLDVDSILRFEYAGQPVLTSVQLAALFACTPANIQGNFGYHRDEFTEGIDYFKLIGDELVEFRKNFSKNFCGKDCGKDSKKFFSGSEFFQWIPPKGRVLYLWTKSGVALFARSITTFQAKLTFVALEQGYFNPPAEKNFSNQPADPPVITPVIASAPPPKPYELPNIDLSIRERIDILCKCLDYTDSKNLRNKLITDIAYLVTRKNY